MKKLNKFQREALLAEKIVSSQARKKKTVAKRLAKQHKFKHRVYKSKLTSYSREINKTVEGYKFYNLEVYKKKIRGKPEIDETNFHKFLDQAFDFIKLKFSPIVKKRTDKRNVSYGISILIQTQKYLDSQLQEKMGDSYTTQLARVASYGELRQIWSNYFLDKIKKYNSITVALEIKISRASLTKRTKFPKTDLGKTSRHSLRSLRHRSKRVDKIRNARILRRAKVSTIRKRRKVTRRRVKKKV